MDTDWFYINSDLSGYIKIKMKSKFLESYLIIMYHFYRNKEEEK